LVCQVSGVVCNPWMDVDCWLQVDIQVVSRVRQLAREEVLLSIVDLCRAHCDLPDTLVPSSFYGEASVMILMITSDLIRCEMPARSSCCKELVFRRFSATRTTLMTCAISQSLLLGVTLTTLHGIRRNEPRPPCRMHVCPAPA
jgi:hypothetical protein